VKSALEHSAIQRICVVIKPQNIQTLYRKIQDSSVLTVELSSFATIICCDTCETSLTLAPLRVRHSQNAQLSSRRGQLSSAADRRQHDQTIGLPIPTVSRQRSSCSIDSACHHMLKLSNMAISHLSCRLRQPLAPNLLCSVSHLHQPCRSCLIGYIHR
jgi:hypothetical protein